MRLAILSLECRELGNTHAAVGTCGSTFLDRVCEDLCRNKCAFHEQDTLRIVGITGRAKQHLLQIGAWIETGGRDEVRQVRLRRMREQVLAEWGGFDGSAVESSDHASLRVEQTDEFRVSSCRR